jgi:hypothetical protein
LPEPDFEVDVKDTDENGAFSCPECKSVIHPDDDSEKTYTIADREDDGEHLVSLTFKCSTCQKTTKLKGFPKIEQELTVMVGA